MGPNASLVKNAKGGAAVNGYRLVKMGSADDTVIEAVDGTAAIIGVAGPDGITSGGRGDIVVFGIATVKAGGTITRGDYVTATTAGKAVTSAPAAGVNSNVAGIALNSAVTDDEFQVLLNPSRIQG